MEKKSPSKRGTKTKNKIKKHSLRVVYISNPMKITIRASDFLATVQQLTGKDAVWPSDLEFNESQTAPNETTTTTITTTTTSSDNNVSIISDDSDCGVELFPPPNPSPDSSDDLYFQPSDLPHHDVVLLLDQNHGLPVFNDQEFESLIQSDNLDFFNY